MSHRIIEKRRRDRMNNCLADLSRLIPAIYLKKVKFTSYLPNKNTCTAWKKCVSSSQVSKLVHHEVGCNPSLSLNYLPVITTALVYVPMPFYIYIYIHWALGEVRLRESNQHPSRITRLGKTAQRGSLIDSFKCAYIFHSSVHPLFEYFTIFRFSILFLVFSFIFMRSSSAGYLMASSYRSDRHWASINGHNNITYTYILHTNTRVEYGV